MRCLDVICRHPWELGKIQRHRSIAVFGNRELEFGPIECGPCDGVLINAGNQSESVVGRSEKVLCLFCILQKLWSRQGRFLRPELRIENVEAGELFRGGQHLVQRWKSTENFVRQ